MADEKPEDDKEKKEAAPAGGDAKSADTSNSEGDADSGEGKAAEKPGGLKQTLKKFRLYLLIILLVAVVCGVFVVVSSLNKKKAPPPASIQSQSLSQNQLKKQAATGLSTSGQTISIQGNAILDGQEAMKGNLFVAGDVQTGGALNIPELTLSGSGNLGNAQLSKLQVATTATFTGQPTFQNGMNVNGTVSFSSASFGTLTATRLNMEGNATITVPHHLMFTGAFPHRTISFGVLGNGGSASVNGSDTNGTVSINTGNNPQPGCFITVIFNIPFAQGANILLGPIGLGAGAIQYSAQPTTSSTTNATTGFKICTANTPLPNQAFGFSYLVNGAPNS